MRVVFISASQLVRQWRSVPQAVLESSLFFFGSKRKWLFPETDADKAESRAQPTDYLGFHSDFRALILAKEQRGEVFFLKPADTAYAGDFAAASAWLTRLADPATGEAYGPLLLEEGWWMGEGGAGYSGRASFVRASGRSVVRNFQTGDHDYDPTMELVRQSNAGLLPCLCWDETLAAKLDSVTE